MTSRLRLLPLVLVALLALTAACGSGSKEAKEKESKPAATKGECVYGTNAGEVAKKVSRPPSTPITKVKTAATISTNRGDIKVTLDADTNPCTVNSFLSLIEQGYYDNSPCHRLVTGGIFVLQCGDPSGTGQKGPGYTITDELIPNDPRLTNCQGTQQCTYPAGTLAMAKLGDQSGYFPDTAESQFFLVYGDSPLEPGYEVFGHMDAAGLKVVQGIAKGGAVAADPVTGATPPKLTTMITGIKIG